MLIYFSSIVARESSKPSPIFYAHRHKHITLESICTRSYINGLNPYTTHVYICPYTLSHCVEIYIILYAHTELLYIMLWKKTIFISSQNSSYWRRHEMLHIYVFGIRKTGFASITKIKSNADKKDIDGIKTELAQQKYGK